MRQWTVVTLPDDHTAVRQYRLSREVVRGTSALVLFMVAALIALAAAFLAGSGAASADARLVAKNEVLERELGELVARLDTLQGSLAHLSEKDQHYRLMAALDPVHPDVLMAGIGGPDADSLEASALYGVDRRTGRQPFSASIQMSALLRRADVLASSWSEAERALTGSRARLGATPSIYPTQGYVSSSYTSSRLHPVLPQGQVLTMSPDVLSPIFPVVHKRQLATASTHPYQFCTCHMCSSGVCCPSSWASPMRIPSGPRM